MEEDSCSFSTPFPVKRMENWEDQLLYPSANTHTVDAKQEILERGYECSHGNEEIQACRSPWSHVLPTSSPRSCVTSFSSNVFDISNSKAERKHLQPENSFECNSTTGAALKKARVQDSSAQSPLKVRKQRLGDRITALHQLVSPFGKTDTASVLLESIGYIRFLQSQIEVLSSPYLGGGTRSMRQSGKGERSSIFPEDPGQQLLNDTCMKRRGAANYQDGDDEPKDLKSRGLCLVPVSYTMHVGGDGGVDCWAPAFGGGFSMDCTESAARLGLTSGYSIISGHSANPKVDCS